MRFLKRNGLILFVVALAGITAPYISALGAENFFFEQVIADRDQDSYQFPGTPKECQVYCDEVITAALDEDNSNGQSASYRCALETKLKQFGRGDYRRVPLSCKVVRMINVQSENL